jgi:hypothetical protein
MIRPVLKSNIPLLASPIRLANREITVTIDDADLTLNFVVNLPDDPTEEEIAYLRTYIGERVAVLRAEFPGLIGEACREQVTVEPS